MHGRAVGLVLLVSSAWACAGGATAPAPPSPPPAFVASAGDLAITGATVLPMTSDGALAQHTVVIRGDRIVAVAPSARVQLGPGVTAIDGAGRWLLPALADMHVHTWDEDDFPLFLAAGVTTIRNMWGIPQHPIWRAQIERGERLGPAIVTAGALIDGAPPDWPGSVVLATAAGADALVAAQRAAGYDFLKPVSRLSPAAYSALAAAGARHGLALAGHVPYAVGLDGVLAARQRAIEHLDGYPAALVRAGATVPSIDDPIAWMRAIVAAHDPARLPALVERTRAAGTWNCPTLIIYDRVPELHDGAALARRVRWLDQVPAARRARWLHSFAAARPTAEAAALTRAFNAIALEVFAALAAAGAPLLPGTDTGGAFLVPGEALHDELELMVAAGLPRDRVLRAATADAWRFLGRPGEAGVVAPGARADLVLVASDPLRAPLPLVPDGVMVRGRWLPRTELDAMLAARARRLVPPGERWAGAPPLATDGAPAHRAQYDVALDGTPVAAERIAVAVAPARTVIGELHDPVGAVDATYRVGPDRAAVTAVYHTMTIDLAGAIAGGALRVTGTDLAGRPVSLEAPVPPGAVLSARAPAACSRWSRASPTCRPAGAAR